MGIRYPGESNTPEQECEYLKDLLYEDDHGFFFSGLFITVYRI